MLGLADADDRDRFLPISSVAPLQDADQVLLQAGPAGGVGDRPVGLAPVMRLAASPIRMSPAAIIGLAASGPPDGLTLMPAPSPSA